MDSVRKRPNGTCEVRFIDRDKERRSIYVGKIVVRDAEGTTLEKIVTKAGVREPREENPPHGRSVPRSSRSR